MSKRPRCLAITWAKTSPVPRACGEPTHGDEYCRYHAAMFVMLADRRPPEKAVQR